jgi:hypothetical protein
VTVFGVVVSGGESTGPAGSIRSHVLTIIVLAIVIVFTLAVKNICARAHRAVSG